METSYRRNDKIIRRKFYQYLIPTVLMVVAMQFGSLADAIVVGNFLGSDALSAASLALPVIFLVELPGFAVAAGAGIVGANLIGKRQIVEASKTFKIGLLFAFLTSLIFIPLGIFVADPLASWLAGEFAGLQNMIMQYARMYMLQSPAIALGLVVAYFLPSDNNPTLGAIYFIISNVAHIVSEIIFCIALPMENVMYGVAGSMGIGMLAGLFVMIPYALSKTRQVNLKTGLKGSTPFLWDTLKAGSSSAVMIALSCVFYLVMNLAATAYLKEQEMPIYAMLSNFSFVIDLFIVGIFQVMPSIIPALLGEKDYFAIRSIAKRVFLLGMGVTGVLLAISLIFPQVFFTIFGVNLGEINQAFLASPINGIADPLFVVRIYVLSFILYTINRFMTSYYPSIMVNPPGIISNITRMGVVGPVCIYFLMQALGVIGYAYGDIIMEGATLLITLLAVLIGKKMGRFSGKGVFLLPQSSKKEGVLDISLPAKKEEISHCSEELQRFASENGGNPTSSAMLALACEEIIANIIDYGYKKGTHLEYIDVSIETNEDNLLVRIRDDGIAFDPTNFVPGDDEIEQFSGIEVVRKVAKSFKYLRVLNTNNTIMEIALS